ncbi:CRTAC1 family protein [Roseivivax sediminis]|uniref:Repeat domain-containing protein n=1 Tax=Roseivivax sediminis TaxID=936889 RepID=A0A1I2CFL3_9RHOB|nr:CRTAC1 family protein [Roseivivax sediminis]SFE67076.1 Repeat domain-containing protein [Roseivivax sediminis]
MKWLALFLAAPVAAEPTFVDRSGGLPVAHVYSGGWEHFVGGGLAVLDCNGDARPDMLAAGGAAPARLFVNATQGPGAPLRFETGELPEMTGVTGAYPLDIDGDGPLDLVVLRVGANAILKGDGACGFTDATADLGLDPGAAWTTAFSATWEDGETLPTLAFGNYVDRSDPDGPFEACDDNALIRPDGDLYGPPVPLSPGWCALSMLISDWQRTGTPELRISNDRHYYVRGGHEEMWRLDPLEPRGTDDGWEEVSLWGMGIASADVDGNGFPDVMLTSMGDQLLQFGNGTEFVSAPYSVGTYAQRPHVGDDGRPATGWHAEFGDIDNDGRLDLFIAKGNVDQMPSNAMKDPNNLLMQGPEAVFAEASVAAGIATTARSRGAALVDFDGDGRLDLAVVNRRAPMELWQNRTPDTGHWLSVELRQAAPNTRAVGAWIERRTEAGVVAREVTVGGGHAGGQAGPVHFGLGGATRADLRVRWPGADWSAWQSVDAGQRVRLERETLPPLR